MALPTSRKITLSFAGALVLLAIGVVIVLIDTTRDRDLDAGAAHAIAMRVELHALDVALRQAKTDGRSFLITGDSSYLRRRETSLVAANAAFANLERLTAASPRDRAPIEAIRRLASDRTANFDETMVLDPLLNRGWVSDALRLKVARGEEESERISAIIDSMDTAQRAILLGREAARDRTSLATRVAIFSLALLGGWLAWLARRSLWRDLAAGRRAQDALRESEARLSGILSIAADAIITVDAAQRVLIFNHGAEDIFGYRAEEVLGESLDLLLPLRAKPVHRAHFDRFLAGKQMSVHVGAQSAIIGRRRNGEEFPADATISKLDTPRGPVLTVMLRDVTDERALERHERVLADVGRRLVDTLDYDAVLQVVAQLPVPEIGDWCIVDMVDEVARGQRVMERVVSHSEDPRLEQTLQAIASQRIDDDAPSRVVDVLRSGRAELITDVTEEWLEAHTLPGQMAAARALGIRSLVFAPLLRNDGSAGVITIGTTDGRRRLNAADLALAEAIAVRARLAIDNAANYRRAQQATRARDEVLGVVSHDLRNPLSAVTMHARALLDGMDESEHDRRRLLQSMLDGADMMHRMMQDLLDVTSIEGGRLAVEIEPQSPWQLIEAALGLHESRAAQARLQLVADLDPATPLISADGERVLQVLGNLVGNAIKYTRPGGVVTIGAEPRGPDVLFRVSDSGAGIAPEHLPHVFDRFWHVRGASRTRGAGLGLAIANGIVVAHGGRIWVESTVGQGSTFWFTIPAAPPAVRLHTPGQGAAATA